MRKLGRQRENLCRPFALRELKLFFRKPETKSLFLAFHYSKILSNHIHHHVYYLCHEEQPLYSTPPRKDNAMNYLWISDTPCYSEARGYSLTLYVADNGEIMLAAEGNGCADDIPMDDIDGWSDADINEQYRSLNLDQLRDDASSLRESGRDDDADWLDGWIDRAEMARRNIVIELDHMGHDATEDDRDKFIEALHNEGYTWARAANDGEEGNTDGITDFEWSRIMDEAFNR